MQRIDTVVFIVMMLMVGAGVGVMSAALGIGGGVLMVPAFLSLFPDIDIHTARGSSMLIIMFVATYNAVRMNRGDMKNPLRLILVIAIGSVIGGYIGGALTALLPDEIAIWIFIGLLFFAGARAFLLKEKKVDEDEVRKREVTAAFIGLAAGIVAGATGTGGGAIFVPLALWAGIVSNYRVVALSNAVMIAAATAGTIAHAFSEKSTDMDYTIGMVNYSLAPFVVIGAVAAAPIGRRINKALSFERRRMVMGALLLLITIRLIYRTVT